jgi:hypothetical protein
MVGPPIRKEQKMENQQQPEVENPGSSETNVLRGVGPIKEIRAGADGSNSITYYPPGSEGTTEHFAAAFMPESANDEKRTVECVAYSGAKIPRYDWRTGEEYDITLSLDKSAVRMDRMNNGAPVCDSHSTYSVMGQPGVVEKCWVKDGKLRAKVRFSMNESITPLWNDVKNGIVRNWSIGAFIYQKRDVTEKDNPRRQMLAIDWEPYELSVVPVPADAKAITMAAEPAGETITTGATAQQGAQMKENVQQPGEAARVENVALAAGPDEKQIQASAKAAERTRVSTIQGFGLQFKMDAAFIKEMTDGDTTVEEAREKIMNKLAKDAEEQHQTRSVHVGRDAGDTMRASMIAALLFRNDPSKHKDQAELAAQYRACTMLEMAKECLTVKGESWRGKNAGDIAMAAITRSDLPNILGEVTHRTLRSAYELAPQTFKPWTRRATAVDFRAISRVQLSGAPALLKVNENGEFEQGPLSEATGSYFLLTYGRIINVSRQVIVNDDLNALTRIPAAFGAKAAQLESDLVYKVLTDNAVMADGYNLFSTEHGNLGTAAAVGITPVDEAYTDMALQTSENGDILTLEPKFVLIPTGKRALFNQFLNPLNAAVASITSLVPGYMQSLIPIAEPRLQAHSPTAYYFIADPALIDTVEYCYLEGQEGVYQETQMGFEVDGMKIKARLDFAAAAIDHRGMSKNAGA